MNCTNCGHKVRHPNSILGILYSLFGEIDFLLAMGHILFGIGFVLGTFVSWLFYFISIFGFFLMLFIIIDPEKPTAKAWKILFSDMILWILIFLGIYTYYYIIFVFLGNATYSSVGLGGVARYLALAKPGICG